MTDSQVLKLTFVLPQELVLQALEIVDLGQGQITCTVREAQLVVADAFRRPWLCSAVPVCDHFARVPPGL